MTLDISATNSRGLVREKNDDMMLVASNKIRNQNIRFKIQRTSDENCIFAVADGLGGYSGGDVASAEVVNELDFFFHSLPKGMDEEAFRDCFNAWIVRTHKRLLEMGQDNPQWAGMGTTLVALVIYEKHIYWLNCGDSRLYRYRGRRLAQLSTDHSLSSLTGNSTHENVLVNSIGAGKEAYFDIVNCTDDILAGDVMMLCSDGLSKMLTDEKMEKLLGQTHDSRVLEREACKAGGLDNISVCLVHFIRLMD